MNCSQVQKRLSAYIDGEITEKERILISKHLGSCPSCTEELNAIKALGTVMNDLDHITVPAYFRAHVKQRIKDQGSRPLPIIEIIRRAVFPVTTTAALIISILIGNFIGKTLYRDVAEIPAQEDSEIAGTFGLTSMNEFPEGSLSNVYYEYVPGGN
jgi:anti-sigma factor RsiW